MRIIVLILTLSLAGCGCASIGWWNPSKEVFYKTRDQEHYAAGFRFKITPEKCSQDPEIERLRKQRREVLKTIIPILPAAGVRPTL